jgi:hypothetical protein
MQIGEYLEKDTGASPVTLTTAADKATFNFPSPVDVVGWGIIITTLLDVGAGAIFACDRRITAGSDTGRVDAAGGTITTPADVAVGKVIYHELTTRLELNAGDQIVIEATDAPDTGGAGILFVRYQPRGLHLNQDRAADVVGYAS